MSGWTPKPGWWHALPDPDSPKKKPARDSLVIQTEKAYRASNQYQLDKLLRLEARYHSRFRLAEMGLIKTRRKIRSMLLQFSQERLKAAHKLKNET